MKISNFPVSPQTRDITHPWQVPNPFKWLVFFSNTKYVITKHYFNRLSVVVSTGKVLVKKNRASERLYEIKISFGLRGHGKCPLNPSVYLSWKFAVWNVHLSTFWHWHTHTYIHTQVKMGSKGSEYRLRLNRDTHTHKWKMGSKGSKGSEYRLRLNRDTHTQVKNG